MKTNGRRLTPWHSNWRLCDFNYLYTVYSVPVVFIRLFEKRSYYAVAMSARPSVRPSVRVFRIFLQHALRSQFETWYIHSVGGTTCRIWVASKLGHFDLVYSQKMVKPIFCNHGLINQYNSSNLVHRWPAEYFSISVPFFVKTLFSEFWRLFLWVLDFSKFSGLFFLHVLRYQFETCYIHAVGGATRQVRVSFQSGHFTYFTAKNISKSLSACMALNHIEASDLVHTYFVSVLIPTDFCYGWAIVGPLADKNTWKGMLLELPASEKFSGLFCARCEISVWNLAYPSSGWCHTSSSSFIPIWTLWPTLQPKIGQSHLSAFMALKII